MASSKLNFRLTLKDLLVPATKDAPVTIHAQATLVTIRYICRRLKNKTPVQDPYAVVRRQDEGQST